MGTVASCDLAGNPYCRRRLRAWVVVLYKLSVWKEPNLNQEVNCTGPLVLVCQD